jgi:ribosomal protein S27E
MTYFQCDAAKCPNKGVAYYWAESEQTEAQCGGCGETLEAQHE